MRTLRTLALTVITIATVGMLTGCGSDACADAYDALWMTRYHVDGSKTCTYVGDDGDSAYNFGGVTELPYP